MRLMMTGLDHKRANLETREKFAVTKENMRQILTSLKESGIPGGCVIITTCNRTELYVSVPDGVRFEPTRVLCRALDREYSEYAHFFEERTDSEAIGFLCRVAAGLDSQVIGDDQIITQVREALEFARGLDCTDSYMETMFNLAIKAAKAVKTNVILKTLGIDSIPAKAVEKLKSIRPLSGVNAVVIGNGQMGRLVSELLIREGACVTVTLREYHKGVLLVPSHAGTAGYSHRYSAIEKADIVVSATTSPHYTICLSELERLSRLPEIILDLAVPRDVEPSVQMIPGLSLLTIEDISEEGRVLPSGIALRIDGIIEDHIGKYYRWLEFKHSGDAATQRGTRQNGDGPCVLSKNKTQGPSPFCLVSKTRGMA